MGTMERRNFLKSVAAGSLAAGPLTAAGATPIPKRTYKDDVKLSVIGFGAIVVCGTEQDHANRIVAESIERGVNYFDVAPSYFDGEAEIKLGNALRGKRKGIFLACKTTKRDAAGARQELEQSLQRLHTDHFDLYQFHAVSKMDDVEQILAPGGAAETFLAARREGKVRYIGLSAHSAEAGMALMDRLPMDSILFPVNFVLYSQGNFGPQILAHAKKKGMARLALKSMAYTGWPQGAARGYKKCWYKPVDEPELARKAVRFTLSEDITALVPPGEEKLYRMALDYAASFETLSSDERAALLASAKGVEPLFRA